MMSILWGRPLMSLLCGARSRTSARVATLPPWHWRGCLRRVWLAEVTTSAEKNANARMHKGERSGRTTTHDAQEQAGLMAYYRACAIDWRRHFDEECPVHGLHPGRTRASFYADTAARLASEAGKTRRINMSAATSILAGAKSIMDEVGATVVDDGLTESDVVIEVAEARQRLAAARTIVTPIVPPVWMDNRESEDHDGLEHSGEHDAQWKKNVRSAARRIVRLKADNKHFVRVPISTLTQEMERRGGISSRTRAAFYTEVAANLVARASERCG